jgi:regulator of sirC expression with transglutaminase-like and TPR domain
MTINYVFTLIRLEIIFTFFSTANLNTGKIFDRNFEIENKFVKDLNELNALLRLVDEPDEKLFQKVRNRILEYGSEAVPQLEQAAEGMLDEQSQKRILSMIHEIQYQNTFLELNNWAKFNYSDLLRGYLLVTRIQFPDMDSDAVTREVGRIAQEVWLELNEHLTALEKVKVINHILFEINKFSGNVNQMHSPENYFLNKLFETHKGNQISIGILYIIIARSLRIPIYGVDLPRHFILAYADEIPEIQISEKEVLFYLNPFNRGAVFTRNEIELFLKQIKLNSEESYFQPCSNLVIIRRLINELSELYSSEGKMQKADELNHLLSALDL